MHKTNLNRKNIIVLLSLSFFGTAISVMGLPGSQSIFIAPTLYRARTVDANRDKGRTLFQRHQCSSCHSIAGVGGCLAPPLNGVGSRRNKSFILARITNSVSAKQRFQKLYPSQELLDHPRVSSDQASFIADYLMTLSECEPGYHVLKHNVVNDEPHSDGSNHSDDKHKIEQVVLQKGQAAFVNHGCLACHSVSNLGGHFAPALDGLNTRRERSYVLKRITNSEFFIQDQPDEYGERGLVMPPSNLSKEEIEQITDFIMSLPENKPAAN